MPMQKVEKGKALPLASPHGHALISSPCLQLTPIKATCVHAGVKDAIDGEVAQVHHCPTSREGPWLVLPLDKKCDPRVEVIDY